MINSSAAKMEVAERIAFIYSAIIRTVKERPGDISAVAGYFRDVIREMGDTYLDCLEVEESEDMADVLEMCLGMDEEDYQDLAAQAIISGRKRAFEKLMTPEKITAITHSYQHRNKLMWALITEGYKDDYYLDYLRVYVERGRVGIHTFNGSHARIFSEQFNEFIRKMGIQIIYKKDGDLVLFF